MDRLLRRVRRDEDGETLIELIVSIVVLGLVVVSLGTGLVMTKVMSTIHRKQSIASQYLHNVAEVAQSTYVCGSTAVATYKAMFPTPLPVGLTPADPEVRYWDGSKFAATSCALTSDPGLLRVKLTLVSSDNLVSESLLAIVRNSA